jgi:hypothetical protein
MNISSLAAAALCCAFSQQAYSFQATPNHKLSFVPRMNSHGSNHGNGNQLRTFTSNSRVPSSALRMAFEDDTENKNNINIPPEQQPTSMAYNTGSDDPTTTSTSSTTSSSSTTTTSSTTGATTTATATATVPKDKILSDLERALMEARELKAKAEKERLEAERMSIQLTLSKIASLEDKLLKLDMGTSTGTSGDSAEDSESENENLEFDKNLVKKSEEYKMQIQSLKKQLEASTSSSSSATTSTSIPSVSTPSTLESSTTTTSAPPQNTIVENANDNDTFDESTIPPMPEEVYTKRSEAFKRFPLEIKTIYAKAVGANEDDDIETIVNKLYITEQREKKIKELAKDGENTISMLDIANAQAGYSTLPPQIQEMISESVGLENERNTTAIIEKLIAADKVKPTGDFGGVEFAMGDPDENEERGTEREFTKKEIKEAIDLFDNLPLAMKSMLSAGVGVDDNNSTNVIMKMIEEKKILPSKEGVEFVVFGDDKEDLVAESMEMIENDNYVRSMLPDVMRNEGNMPSPEEADAFFTEVLGGKTFNPECRPEPIPGGYIIRGENRMKTNDELVAALEEKMAKSSVAGKLNLYLIRDPTLVTEEQFETGTYELPVIMITGTNISPSTNRAVKPLVTVFGATCIAFFALAVSFATEDANQDPVWLEQMVTPMLISILATQAAHEAAHQVVAFKDKVCTRTHNKLMMENDLLSTTISFATIFDSSYNRVSFVSTVQNRCTNNCSILPTWSYWRYHSSCVIPSKFQFFIRLCNCRTINWTDYIFRSYVCWT